MSCPKSSKTYTTVSSESVSHHSDTLKGLDQKLPSQPQICRSISYRSGLDSRVEFRDATKQSIAARSTQIGATTNKSDVGSRTNVLLHRVPMVVKTTTLRYWSFPVLLSMVANLYHNRDSKRKTETMRPLHDVAHFARRCVASGTQRCLQDGPSRFLLDGSQTCRHDVS